MKYGVYPKATDVLAYAEHTSSNTLLNLKMPKTRPFKYKPVFSFLPSFLSFTLNSAAMKMNY